MRGKHANTKMTFKRVDYKEVYVGPLIWWECFQGGRDLLSGRINGEEFAPESHIKAVLCNRKSAQSY